MNVNDIYLRELIGSKIMINKSFNKNNNNIKGRLIDETRNMMIIDNGKRKCMIPKNGTLFTVEFDGKEYSIDGSIILMKPEDRTKEKRRIYKKLRSKI
ncbi:MAG: ribonuclease P protein subunit [Ferroplasma sp.]